MAERPRSMGLRGEVADGGENLEDHPALASRYVGRKAPFQRANSSSPPLNLFHSSQTQLYLGHCITRGISQRRQANIFRLRGATLFCTGAEASAGTWAAPAGLKACGALSPRPVQGGINFHRMKTGTLPFGFQYCRSRRKFRLITMT